MLLQEATPAEVNRDVARFDPVEDLVHVIGDAPPDFGKVPCIGHQPPPTLMGPDLAAGVPFYGAQPSAADAAKIKAPINAQYGEQDTRITDGWPAFDAALT